MKNGWQAFVFGASALFALGAAGADKVYRIGVTKIVAHAALDAAERGVVAGLASAGLKEGTHVVFDRQNAEGDMGKAEAIARKFVADKVDLIVGIATPTAQAAVKVAGNMPVVFSSVTDPVGAGIVPKNSAPGKKSGTNVTGVSDALPVALQLQTYAKVVPKAKRWGTIYNPAESNSVHEIKAMREAAEKLGLSFVEAKIAGTKDVPQAMASLVGKIDAFVTVSDNATMADFEAIIKVCNEKKIPLFAGDIDNVVRGAVAAYGLDQYLVGYSAGRKAALILKGGKPGDVPWGPVEKFSLVVNEKAAAAQAVVLSPDFIKKADKVIR